MAKNVIPLIEACMEYAQSVNGDDDAFLTIKEATESVVKQAMYYCGWDYNPRTGRWVS